MTGISRRVIYRLLAMETARFSYSMQVMLEDLLPEQFRPYLMKDRPRELSFGEKLFLTLKRPPTKPRLVKEKASCEASTK